MVSGIYCLQKSCVQIEKYVFFLDLTNSGHFGQYLAGTGPELTKSGRIEPEPDIRSHTEQIHQIRKMAITQFTIFAQFIIKFFKSIQVISNSFNMLSTQLQ